MKIKSEPIVASQKINLIIKDNSKNIYCLKYLLWKLNGYFFLPANYNTILAKLQVFFYNQKFVKKYIDTQAKNVYNDKVLVELAQLAAHKFVALGVKSSSLLFHPISTALCRVFYFTFFIIKKLYYLLQVW